MKAAVFGQGGFLSLLGFGRNRDGQSAGVQDIAAEQGTAFAAQATYPSSTQRSGRRSPALTDPSVEILGSAATKILNAWLQNRHQTLFPLTINLRRLEPGQVTLLLQVTASTMTSTGAVDPNGRAQIDTWLSSVGASTEQQQQFHAALRDPPPLGPVLREVQKADLGAHAYAMGMHVIDQRDTASRLFLEFLAARLLIPSHIVRSVNRRYAV